MKTPKQIIIVNTDGTQDIIRSHAKAVEQSVFTLPSCYETIDGEPCDGNGRIFPC